MKDTFCFEITDTFGGEANYCWVRRYKVRSVSMLGAVQKLSRYTGYRFKKLYSGTLTRYDATNATVCAFGMTEHEAAQAPAHDYFEYVEL